MDENSLCFIGAREQPGVPETWNAWSRDFKELWAVKQVMYTCTVIYCTVPSSGGVWVQVDDHMRT